MAKRPMIRLAPRFVETVARAELSIAELAQEAGLSRATLYALLNPSQHPERKGGMRVDTAWKIANAFARRAGLSPDAAYAALIVAEEG